MAEEDPEQYIKRMRTFYKNKDDHMREHKEWGGELSHDEVARRRQGYRDGLARAEKEYQRRKQQQQQQQQQSGQHANSAFGGDGCALVLLGAGTALVGLAEGVRALL